MDNSLQEILDFCGDYYNYVRPSFEHNATLWGDGGGYAAVASNMRSWIESRADYVYSRLTPYDISDPDDSETEGIVSIDNGSERSVADVYSISGVLLRKHIPLVELRNSLQSNIYSKRKEGKDIKSVLFV